MADDAELLAAERAARVAAESVCQQRDAMLSRVSHDLRTPISAILMWVDVLRQQPGELTRGLQAIERSARALVRVLDELAARRAEAATASPAPPSPLARSGEPALADVKVLVVEDEPDVRELLRLLLEASRATVFAAESADAALALLATERPDVLVSDLGMPGRDGFSLIRAVRGLDAQHGGLIPAVALTAFARAEDRTRALAAGYQFHLAKPVEAGELIAAIATLAGRRDR